MKNEIGHYSVGAKVFGNKFDAVLHAQQSNEKINWYFHDKTFDNVNWLQEPDLDLNTLYRLRAEQIRANYDYIIIFCSGGSDSNNVIRTFLKNKIKVDEVIAIAPLEGLGNWNWNNYNTNEDNTISEIKYALFPLLQEISTEDPGIKITINDYFSEVNKKSDEFWTHESCGDIVTTLTANFTNIDKFPHINKLIEQGKRVGLIYGSDKPIIRCDTQDNLLFVFSDGAVNYLNLPNYRQRPNVDRVLFYWSPDCPELMVKQAHVVGKAIALPENKILHSYLRTPMTTDFDWSFDDLNMARINSGKDPISKDYILTNNMPTGVMSNILFQLTNRSTYERLIVPFIYPTTYTKDLFQCQKVNVDEGFFTKDQAWVHVLHKNSRLSQMIISGTKSLYNSISPKYLNKNGTSFKINIKKYRFGNLRDFIKC